MANSLPQTTYFVIHLFIRTRDAVDVRILLNARIIYHVVITGTRQARGFQRRDIILHNFWFSRPDVLQRAAKKPNTLVYNARARARERFLAVLSRIDRGVDR